MTPDIFFSHVEYSDYCWEWIGRKNSNGYGQKQVNGVLYKAHRWSYEYFVGPLGDKHCLHLCDNPKCVNPFHLYAGTHAENMRDIVLHGRHFNKNKKFCVRGHAYDEQNTYISTNGKRVCRKCQQIYDHNRGRTPLKKAGELAALEQGDE